MYNVKSLKEGIESAKKNIKVFEDAIEKERETIKEYYYMIEVIENKERQARTKEEILKNIVVETVGDDN